MYQTVGQDAIELVAQALEVPLYRGFISGSAINQGSEYGMRSAHHKGGTEGDETEDLFELLSIVKVCPICVALCRCPLMVFGTFEDESPRYPRCFSWGYSFKLPESAGRTCVRIRPP